MSDLSLPRALPLHLLPLAIAAALAPLTAAAQEATTLDRIEVTGSRIRAAHAETRQPILTITRDDIAKQGHTSVADILQNLSSAG